MMSTRTLRDFIRQSPDLELADVAALLH